ncbi:MAG TPA: tRNA-intron lyase [Candidatus Nanoarchaeia archaeon]|nr:tRNA-intron lyase [Candidatus Nanoarchaeia archaeon]
MASKKQGEEKKEERKEEKFQQEAIVASFSKDKITTENSDPARELYNQSRYGALLESGRVQLSLIEALYLLDRKKIKVVDAKGKSVDFENLLKKGQKIDPNLFVRYAVFKDIRNKGYIIKTALKFGADFRVYDRGIKPGEDHAKWVVFPVHESSSLTWYEFSAKNRVAHSTKKRLLMGIVDDEGDVTYYEIKWMRP